MKQMANSLPTQPAPSPVSGHGLWTRVTRYARCADSSLDPDEWFPASVTPDRARREAAAAIAVCNGCLVRGECLALSLRHWDIGQYGIWGGLIPADRARLRWAQAAGPGGLCAASATIQQKELAMIKALTRPERQNRIRLLLLPAAAAAVAVVAACSSPSAPSGTSSSGGSSSAHMAAAADSLKTTKIGGVTVLTNANGFTLYSFAPDTPTKSNCNGICAQNWPPVKGSATAAGVKGTFGTIKRSNGATQATFDGHPLYTFVGDTAPGQNKGNGLNAAGGLWHEVTTSGGVPASSSSSGAGGTGNGY